MRIVLQRVSRASVSVAGRELSAIGAGLLVLLAIEDADTQADMDWLVRKICQLRIFDDERGVMNRSLEDVDGDVLVVSQFTLMASVKKGNRPSWIRASGPGVAVPLYEQFLQKLEERIGKPAGSGEFGAHMEVSLVNDGPVTIILDTRQKDF
ncbi:MAG: D-aminoacyl-tRNA deacylase [Mangrovibacterium sp.]